MDMVIEGANDHRLAIELDGDKYDGPDRWTSDYMRQLALERMGWRFWRWRGSSWTLEPDVCLSDLERTLRSMGIEPLGVAKSAVIYTEHRVVSAGGQEARPSSESVYIDVRTAASREGGEPITGARTADRPARTVVAEDGTIGPGDRVVVVYTDDPGHHRTIVITEGEADDMQMGVTSVRSPIARA